MCGKKITKKLAYATVVVMLIFQLAGCGTIDSKEMVELIDSGQSVVIEVNNPSYEIEIIGEQQDTIEWVQLDQLKTYNKGFRQGFDEVFNINIITENGVNGKSGCLYVDEAGDRNGNTTLEDALRNKVFVTKYWEDTEVKEKLIELAREVYSDVKDDDTSALVSSFNAYYNLLPDAENPTAFNSTKSLTRKDFYTLVYKTEEGVQDIEIDKGFSSAVGESEDGGKFAQEVYQYGFLDTDNKSLDETSYKGAISRAEAIYLLVNKHFPDKLEEVTGKEDAYTDTKNARDLAYKADFKYKDEETGEIVGKDRWQAYTLAYMVQNPEDGMQEELYKAMVVAKEMGIIQSDESRWDEPVSREEGLQMIINTHLAKNKVYGYLSEVEYGNVNVNKFKIYTGDGKDWAEVDEGMTPSDPNKILSSGITLWDAKISIDELYEMKEEGFFGDITEEEFNELVQVTLDDLGTTLAEIRSLPSEEEIAKQRELEEELASDEKPTTSTTKKSTSSSSSSSSSGSSSTSGSSLPPEADKNNDGVNDYLEESSGHEGGYSVPMDDEDIHLEAW